MDDSCLVNILEGDGNFACNGDNEFLCKTRLWRCLHQCGKTATWTVFCNNPKLGIDRKCLEDCVDILRSIVFKRLQNACFTDEFFNGVVFGINICLIILDIDLDDLDSTDFLRLSMLAGKNLAID
jgi:hypothetical protein